MKRFFLCAAVALISTTAVIAQVKQAEETAKHAAAEPHGKAESESSNLMPWKWANFVLLAGGIGYLLAKNAGPFFRSRTDEIRKGIDESAKMKAEPDARYAAMDRRLANLDTEIASLRQNASAEAAAEAARLQKETGREVAKIQEQSQRDIEAAAKAARQELRAYSAGLAVDLAKERIRERMTAQDQDALVQSLVGDLKKKAAPEPVKI